MSSFSSILFISLVSMSPEEEQNLIENKGVYFDYYKFTKEILKAANEGLEIDFELDIIQNALRYHKQVINFAAFCNNKLVKCFSASF